MRCPVLSVRELKKIVIETFHDTLGEFFYPPIPEPKIVWRRFKDELISFNHETWDILINVSRTPKLFKSDLQRFYRVVSRKTISYYVSCPYDIETAAKIFVSAISETNKKIGSLASNLLIEIVNTAYLKRINKSDLIWFYKILVRDAIKRGLSKSMILILLIMEKILDATLISEEKKLITDKLLDASDEAYRNIIYGGILTKELWPIKAGRLAKIIHKIISSNTKHEYNKTHSLASEIFLRNLDEFSMFLSLTKASNNLEGIDLETIKSRIVRSVIKDETELVKATPAIESLGIFKKPREIVRFWYRERAKGRIRIELSSRREKEYSIAHFPNTWRITDSIEKLDVILSLSSFPKMLPNLTTKKWEVSTRVVKENVTSPPDLLIIIDSSGSMGYYTGWIKPKIDKRSAEYRIMKKLGLKYLIGSKFDIAVTAAFAALEYALSRNVMVAAINFSGKGIACEWTRDRKKVEDCIMIFQGNGTEFPVKKFKEVISANNNNILIILITDSEIFNEKETISCLREAFNEGHIIYLFHIEKTEKSHFLSETANIGEIIHIKDIDSLVDIVVGRVRKHYEVL